MQIQSIKNTNQKVSYKASWIKASTDVANENFESLKKMANHMLGDEFNSDPVKPKLSLRVLSGKLNSDEFEEYKLILQQIGVRQDMNSIGDVIYNSADIDAVKSAPAGKVFEVACQRLKKSISMQVFPEQIKGYWDNLAAYAATFGLK